MRTPILGLLSTLFVATAGLACGGAGEAGSLMDMAVDQSTLPPMPNIKHVVIIVQENHTFDAYFGSYCTATAGSNPSCNLGPGCCEAAPAVDPSGAKPMVLDDTANGANDRNHTQACELTEMNGGKMDRYVKGANCSDPINFAVAPPAVVKPYHTFATQYALADRYFQPLVGQSASNNMYFAVARFVFKDNDESPSAVGHGCWGEINTVNYTDQTTIADLLIRAGKGFAFYAQGYDAMHTTSTCPGRPSDCTFSVPLVIPNPCIYSPDDVPFEYYAQFKDNDKYMKNRGFAGNTRRAVPLSLISPRRA